MLSKKKNKLSIVTALIVGTTMLSSADKAWGMNEEEAARLKISSSSSSSNKGLLVRSTYVSLNRSLVQDICTVMEANNNQKRLQQIFSGKKDIQTLIDGNFARVMADQRAVTPKAKAYPIIVSTLKAILDNSEADPYDQLVLAHYGAAPESPSAERLQELKDFFALQLKDDLEGFLSRELKYVVDQNPTIIRSLIAHFPQSRAEKENELRAIQSMESYLIAPKRGVKGPVLTKVGDDEQCLINFAERYALLKQIEESLTVPSPSPVILEPVQPFSSSSDMTPSLAVEEAPRFTFRTTGTNLSAKNKHSATSIQLSNQELPEAAYQLIVNHRTGENGSSVRIFIPGIGYSPLGSLPSSVDFEDKDFDLTPWVEAVRGDSSSPSAIKTFLSFVGGKSDVHSFKIQFGGGVLKEVIFGNVDSESQSGIHVYAPETDGEANEWSEVKSDDVQQ